MAGADVETPNTLGGLPSVNWEGEGCCMGGPSFRWARARAGRGLLTGTLTAALGAGGLLTARNRQTNNSGFRRFFEMGGGGLSLS
jgi:hypothetical protein